MAIHDDIGAAVIITALSTGSFELLAEVAERSESSWDRCRQRWLYRGTGSPSAPTDAFAGAFPRGAQLDTRDLWVTGLKPQPLGGGLWELEVTAAGVLEDPGYQLRVASTASRNRYERVSLPGYPDIVDFAEVTEGQTALEVSYPLMGSAPDSDLIGTPQTPPWVPAVRDSFWVATTNPVQVNFPSGWVLDDMTAINLAGLTNVWWVTARYRFEFELTILPASELKQDEELPA